MKLEKLFDMFHFFQNKKEMETYVYQGATKINDVTIHVPWDSDASDMIVVNGTHVLDVYELKNYNPTTTIRNKVRITIENQQLVSYDILH